MHRIYLFLFLLLSASFCFGTIHAGEPSGNRKSEKLGRGVIAIREDAKTVVISWRYLSSDPVDTGFNLYRNQKKINSKPITQSTFFKDINPSGDASTYEVKTVTRGKEQKEAAGSYTLPGNAPLGYLNLPLNPPQGGVTPSGQTYEYAPNDASIGDVDGDGEYEIILKWDPTNAHDNAHKGYTGNVYLDCYKLDGKQLWRIDLGLNIRAGAHYTQFMVFDLDGDNRAEVVVKTSDGTIDGKGKAIGNPEADYRNSDGFILTGSEYLTVFNGLTGAAMETIDYIPPRGNRMDWGDNRGNRMDRYLACVAYLDGIHPSVVMCRGYYTRTVLAAFDWKDGKLTRRWTFDSNTPGNESYAGQGNHSLRVGDVDGDGFDEIVYGSCTIDHDGTGLYTTELGHGDAMHLTVFDPTRKGMQVWACHENKRSGSTYRDAATGEILFQLPSNIDVGRCMAADIDPTQPGVEMWSIDSKGIYNVKGECINPSVREVSINMACWWDGDLLRELLNGNKITKYDYRTQSSRVVFTADGCVSNNGTKSTPCIQGDLVGDWREEVLFRTEDNRNLRLYATTEPTDYRFHTFLEDPVYRISLATENVAYNQPSQPGFYFGADRGKIFQLKEQVIKGNEITLDAGMDYDSYEWSIGGNSRSRTITTRDIPAGKRQKIELTVWFRGYAFKDEVYLTFRP